MRLRELAEIKLGLNVDVKLLKPEKKAGGIYFQCLQPKDFSDGKSYYVYQKDLRRIPNYSAKSFLFYGDYIIYKKEGDFKIFRYEGTSGQTVATNGLIVLTVNLGILKDYFSFEKNRALFCEELRSIEESEDGRLPITRIGEIEIGTDDIRELETSNLAEQIGIRNPIKFSDVPFNIYQKPIPLDKLLKRIKEKELLLDTEFQRRPGLWDLATKSRFIESMIIRLPIPAYYFDGTNDGEWLVIDGLQRLSAANDFVNNQFVLTGLDYLPEIENKAFSELDRPHQRNIEEYEVFAYIIQKGTPKSVTYKIFKNINTSALKLDPQEIRHALNPGPPAMLLRSIAEKPWFRNLLMLTDRQRDRMEDRETALRFIAFQISRFSEYRPTIVDFLDTSMTKIYDIPAVKRQLYEQELESIFQVTEATLGKQAFSRGLFDNSRGYGHNSIMFELITYGFSIISQEKRSRILRDGMDLKSIISKHFELQKDSFWDYEIAYSQESLRKRFEDIEVLFKRLV